jgi:hypothetical protein
LSLTSSKLQAPSSNGFSLVPTSRRCSNGLLLHRTIAHRSCDHGHPCLGRLFARPGVLPPDPPPPIQIPGTETRRPHQMVGTGFPLWSHNTDHFSLRFQKSQIDYHAGTNSTTMSLPKVSLPSRSRNCTRNTVKNPPFSI